MIKKILFLIIIIWLFISVSFAQEKQNPQPKRFAYIIERVFFDKQTGIKDISSFVNMEFIGGNTASQSDSTNNSKNKDTIFEPAKEKLFELLKLIGNQNNLVIVKISETEENGQILALDAKFDLTKKIIFFINSKSSKSVETIKIDIPEGKIGLIETSLFYDKEKGIKKVLKNLNKYTSIQELCSKTTVCAEIGNSIQNYAMKKGFSLVFDLSKNLPAEIRDLPTTDITQEFISDFNRK